MKKEYTIRSPFTGGEVEVINRKYTFYFRGEKFEHEQKIYKCVDTKNTFVLNDVYHNTDLNRVFNMYRERYDLMYPSGFEYYRKEYELTTEQMTKILNLKEDMGWGENEYAALENGYLPPLDEADRLNDILHNFHLFMQCVEDKREVVSKKKYKEFKKRDKAVTEWESKTKKQLMMVYWEGEHEGELFESVVYLWDGEFDYSHFEKYSRKKYSLSDAKLCTREAQVTIYGRTYPYMEHYYVDIPSGIEYVTLELHRTNQDLYYNAYRLDRGLPFPEELKAFREKLGLSLKQMAILYGIDPHDFEYDNIEKGDTLFSLEHGLWVAEAMKNPRLLFPFENNECLQEHEETLEYYFPEEQKQALSRRIVEIMKETEC